MSRTSEAHDHFTVRRVEEDGEITLWRYCNHCPPSKPFRLSKGTSTTVQMGHVAKAHSSVLSSRKRRKGQRTMDDMVGVINNDAFEVALAQLFARTSLAHRIVDLPEFTHLMACARLSNCPMPDRRRLRRIQLQHAQSLRSRLVRQLRNYCHSAPLTVAIDGWTNVNTAKVTNVVILSGGEAFYWCSIVNDRSHNTAAWLAPLLVEVLYSVRAEGLRFTALVADNEQVNKALYDLVAQDFPFLIHSPCSAHLIQLCVLKALALPDIEPIFSTMEAILREFKLKVNRLKLRQLQEVGGGTVYTLLRPCDTRWSSQLHAAIRLGKLQAFVDLVLPQEKDFWSALDQLVTFLKPFQLATDVMQKDTSTMYDCYLQFKHLLTHVRGLPATSLFHPAREEVVSIILDCWEKHINLDAIISCAQLSFDSAVDTIFADNVSTAAGWLQDFAAKYSLFWGLTTSDDYTVLRQQAKHQWSNFLARKADSCFSSVDTDIADLRELSSREGKAFDAREVWCLYLRSAPVLSHAAVALLSIAGSEAAVERTFSAQGDVHSDRRNRLGDGTVEAEMFIKFNERTLVRVEEGLERVKRKRAHVGPDLRCVEMGEDYEEDEDVPSVAGMFSRPPPREAVTEVNIGMDVDTEERGEPEVRAAVRAVPPAPAANEVEAFIMYYVKKVGITSRFTWQDWKLQALEAAGQAWSPPMRDTTDQLKKRIMAWVRSEVGQEFSAAMDAEQKGE